MFQQIVITSEVYNPISKFTETSTPPKLITNVECNNEDYIVKVLREYKDKHKFVNDEKCTLTLSKR